MQVRREVPYAARSAPTPTTTSTPRRAQAREARHRRRAGRDLRARRPPASTPAAISASAQGGVRPWCEHGSSVTNAVAPRARSPARASAPTSAWACPGGSLAPSPDDFAVTDEHAADPRIRRRCDGGRTGRPPAPVPSPRRRARSLTRTRPAGRGNDNEPAARRWNGTRRERRRNPLPSGL